jgi:adenosine deaminase
MERDERLEILRGLPKVDLHRHLEGSIRFETLRELGRRNRVNLPVDNPLALAPLVHFNPREPRSLKTFLSKFHCDWYRSYKDIERVAAEVVQDAALEGVVHLELRFSPEHLTRTSHLEQDGVLQAVSEAARAAAEEYDLGVRLLLTLVRERYDFDRWKRVVDRAAERQLELGVVGVDLAGDEFNYPNALFERIFTRVRDAGVLGISIHAGEGTGHSQVTSAVEVLHARRIGHGLKAVEEPGVMAMLAQRRIALEICPVSNFQTGCVDNLAEHPLPALDQAGVPVTLNSDDPCIHGTTLCDEYDVAATLWGYGLDDLLRLERYAVEAAFLPEEDREALRERVEKGYQESRGQGFL